MSEEDFDEIDKLIDEDDDSNKKLNMSGEEIPIKASNKSSYNRMSSEVSGGVEKMGAQATGIHDTKLDFSKNPVSVITARDLMDGIMPQSPVVKDYISRQISTRLSRDLDSMSNKLNMGNKNKLLRESNDDDYDILIDDNLFDKEGEE